MGDITVISLLKNISIFISVVGILAGLDLLLGMRVMSGLKKVLDKAVDLDKMVINSNVRIFLGILFLLLSAVIILLIKR